MNKTQRETMINQPRETAPEKLAAEAPVKKDWDYPVCPICKEKFNDTSVPRDHQTNIMRRHMLRLHNVDAKDYKPPLPRDGREVTK